MPEVTGDGSREADTELHASNGKCNEPQRTKSKQRAATIRSKGLTRDQARKLGRSLFSQLRLDNKKLEVVKTLIGWIYWVYNDCVSVHPHKYAVADVKYYSKLVAPDLRRSSDGLHIDPNDAVTEVLQRVRA